MTHVNDKNPKKLILSRHIPNESVKLLLQETESAENHFIWDKQTKSLFSLLRVLFAFLWMNFLRDQYRSLAARFGREVSNQDDFIKPDLMPAEELIDSISQLYQFSDVLMCKDELHSAAITASVLHFLNNVIIT